MPTFTIASQTHCLVRRPRDRKWKPFLTSKILTFPKYKPVDGGGSWVFQRSGFLLKINPRFVVGRRSDKKKPPGSGELAERLFPVSHLPHHRRIRNGTSGTRPQVIARCTHCGEPWHVCYEDAWDEGKSPACGFCGESLTMWEDQPETLTCPPWAFYPAGDPRNHGSCVESK